MKILELTNYSCEGDGVFARVKQESILLAKKGHEVRIFSSNRIKGSAAFVPKEEILNEEKVKVKIQRFKAIKLGGESYMYWNFKKEAFLFKPDIIIAHSYRHIHTHIALRIGKKLKIPVLLVTHAPFARSSTRTPLERILVFMYDKLLGKKVLKKFTKVIAITKWEVPYLEKIGLKKEKIIYLPNGIPKIFFSPIKNIESKTKKILYLGRISPIKNLEIVLKVLPSIKDKNVSCKFYGPAEKDYLKKLKRIIKENKLKNIEIKEENYNKKEQLKELDNAFIFILPSKSEGMPQVLIEAMARKKIVIASDILASRDLIINGRNGFLFSLDASASLSNTINQILSLPDKEIRKIQNEAQKSVKEFSWEILSRKMNYLITHLKPNVR